jgi:hypothetical protein
VRKQSLDSIYYEDFANRHGFCRGGGTMLT